MSWLMRIMVVLALVLSACTGGEEFLTSQGPGLDWVGGAEQRQAPSTGSSTTIPAWRAVGGVEWVNDGLVTSSPDDPPALAGLAAVDVGAGPVRAAGGVGKLRLNESCCSCVATRRSPRTAWRCG